jgi:hypothetical protein
MHRELELEPMTGYYRLIEHARSGAQERARYNVPAGDVCVANVSEQPNADTRIRKAPEKHHGNALLKALSRSDVMIGSMGHRRMRF